MGDMATKDESAVDTTCDYSTTAKPSLSANPATGPSLDPSDSGDGAEDEGAMSGFGNFPPPAPGTVQRDKTRPKKNTPAFSEREIVWNRRCEQLRQYRADHGVSHSRRKATRQIEK